jgi:hypothetical protein
MTFEPSPTWPRVFNPQQTSWEDAEAHTESPTATSVTPVSESLTGEMRLTVVPSPTRPWALLPQHQSFWSASIAQVFERETAVFVTGTGMRAWAGVSRFERVPSPTWPAEFAPQHSAVPDAIAQDVGPIAIEETAGRVLTRTGARRRRRVPSPSCP